MHEWPFRRAAPQHWEGMVNVRNGPFVLADRDLAGGSFVRTAPGQTRRSEGRPLHSAEVAPGGRRITSRLARCRGRLFLLLVVDVQRGLALVEVSGGQDFNGLLLGFLDFLAAALLVAF